MEKNIGWFERSLRVVVGGLLLASAGLGQPLMLEGLWVWVAALAGAALVWTGLTGQCWLYSYVDSMVEKKEKQVRKARKAPAKKKAARKTQAKKKAARKSKKGRRK